MSSFIRGRLAFSLFAILASFSCLTAQTILAAEMNAAPAAIRLTNYRDGETIRHPVALIVGELADQNAAEVVLTNTSSKRSTATIKGQAMAGRFKVLAELVPGENKLTLKQGTASLALTIQYKPQTNPYFVRMIYMTDTTGNTAYQSQLADDPQNFAAKLDTAMKLMQTMTAERMHDLGYGRQTFNLELDGEGKVKVHVHKGAKPATGYYNLENDQAWYHEVSKEMNAAFDMKFAKNIVIAAYTRFDPETKKAKGHTALGGGNQGLFGSGNLFTWPSSLHDVQPAFMNTTKMDNSQVQDDSTGRGTFWGAASTTIGATLHEMGHALGLPHTQVGIDIMTRGFDHFNRVFTVAEPTRRAEVKPRPVKQSEAAQFAPISAQSLLTSRWFALDERKYNEKNDISIRFDESDSTIVITSATGVRYFSADVKGDAVYHKAPPQNEAAPKEFRIPLAEITKAISTEDFSIRAANADGHVGRASMPRLKQRATPGGK